MKIKFQFDTYFAELNYFACIESFNGFKANKDKTTFCKIDNQKWGEVERELECE